MSLPRFLTWTYSGNYPAGANPWNGNPLSVAPGYSYFTPNVPSAASEFNYIFGNTLAAVALVPAYAVKNWHALHDGTTVTTLTGASVNSVSYDPTNNTWVVCGDDGTNGKVAWTQDGEVWTGLASITGHKPQFCAVHGTSGNILVFNSDEQVWKVTPGGTATYTGHTVATGGASLGGVAFWYPLAGKVVAVYIDSPNTGLGTSTPDGVTFTDFAMSGAWSAAHVYSYHVAAVKTDGSQALVCFGGTTPITDTSLAAVFTYPGGTLTATDVTLPSGIANSSITGVAWNDSAQLWGVLVNNGDGTLWTSPDLVTWTFTHTFGAACHGLTCVGNYWVVNEAFTYGGGTNTRVAVSNDGVTWAYTDSPIAVTLSQLASSGGQVVTYGASGAAVSFRV